MKKPSIYGVIWLTAALVSCAPPSSEGGKQPSAVAAMYDGGAAEDAARFDPGRNPVEEPTCSLPVGATPHTPRSYKARDDVMIGLYEDPNDASPSDTLTNLGGPIIGTAELQLIFWGSAWRKKIFYPDEITDSVAKIL